MLEVGRVKLSFASMISRRAGPWRVISPHGQDLIKRRWNPPDLEARTALLKLIE
jgi:hypothetical protein